MDTLDQPLLPMLLGPLQNRATTLFAHPGADLEDFEFIRGLNIALEQDLAARRMDLDTLRKCALHATLYMIPARNALAGNPPITPTAWPLPSEPWMEVEGSDPRERLLARMVHQGVDPWMDPNSLAIKPANGKDQKDLLGSTFMGTWLSYGYANLARIAFRMPHGDWDADQIASKRETHHANQPSLLQAAVSQDFLDLADTILNKGANTERTLHLAQSPEMAQRLIEVGCSVDEIVRITHPNKKTDVVGYWLESLPAKTARALVDVAKNHMSPAVRFKQAVKGSNWTPVADAIGAWPEWIHATVNVGKTKIRWPLYLLMTARRMEADQLKHAFRLLAKTPADDREVAPGLTEKALFRLTLERISQERVQSKSEASNQLTEQISKMLSTLANGEPLETVLDADAKALIAVSCTMTDTKPGRYLAYHLMENQRILPHERGKNNIGALFAASPLTSRTLEDLVSLGRVGVLFMRAEQASIGDNGSFAFYGCRDSHVKDRLIMASDPARAWVDRLIKQHPDRLDDIATACLGMLGLGLSTRHPYNAQAAKGDIFAKECQRIEQLFEQGARPQWTEKDCEVLQKAAESAQKDSPYGQVFANQLHTYWQRAELATTPTTPVAEVPRARCRL